MQYSASTRAGAFEILVGNVRDLTAMQARRIAEQEIAFTVQAVGAVLANDHARILFKSHLEYNAPGEADPVEPPISRCGNVVRSKTMPPPCSSRPNMILKLCVFISIFSYRARLCLPRPGPSGCLKQLLLTIEAISRNSRPQYLHSYGPSSRPSYATCFPLPGPSGCLKQELLSNVLRCRLFVPQYMQTYSFRSPPSYNACFPRPGPLGCLGQLFISNDRASRADVPQYLQYSLMVVFLC